VKKRNRGGFKKLFPAGTKLYRKALKSHFGVKGYKAYFDVKPLHEMP
jgi:hypothetical protein